jgi:[acyl-carrier-protein] S-malonyltransferase
MTLALLFPGQGTQHPAMLGWLDDQPEAQATLALMAGQLGKDWRAHLADADWTSRNDVAQVLLTGLGIAAWQSLAARLPAPAVIAGYSVGELPAFCAAGVFDAAAALALACDRAAAMEASVAGLDTGLLAVSGAAAALVDAACRHHGLALAIRQASDRVVLGGPVAALEAAQTMLEAAGAHGTRLAVRLASHTPWMTAAVPVLAQRMAAMPFAAPRATLVCNLSGAAVRGDAALKAALAGQTASPVPWDRCIDAVAERRPRCVLEVGPGSTLAKQWRDRHPEVPARSVDEFRGPAAVAAWVHAALARS